jgi:hypothetical protein
MKVVERGGHFEVAPKKNTKLSSVDTRTVYRILTTFTYTPN